MDPTTVEQLGRALGKAFVMGQTYWQQADSESFAANRRAAETRAKFDALVIETVSAMRAALTAAAQASQSIGINGLTDAETAATASVMGLVSQAAPAQQTQPTPPIPDVWIEWSGGECPVPGRTRVAVRFRNGDRDSDIAAGWDWSHADDETDIVAYRVLTPKEE